MVNLYADKKWAAFRERVIALDGGECVVCNRSRSDGVVLQVHHKRYISGRKPWEYDTFDCETLCRGCHAREHGEIMPDTGWDYVGEDDLGELVGNCELCDTAIRYVHYVQHMHWEQMGVGTDCCDRLTGTKEASEAKLRMGRFKRFMSPERWSLDSGGQKTTYKGFNAVVVVERGVCKLQINGIVGSKQHESLAAAQSYLFDFIDEGEAKDFFQKRKPIKSKRG
ncbi:HNH endonuclease [Pseudomonas sp. zjy_9]